uniref:Uncharacterized protein n=1 Tax=Timema poppense TaxID=170557 RepID=A0A7R9CMP2_TIMPO|nr:unnamed protein product [Timema poppensis]
MRNTLRELVYTKKMERRVPEGECGVRGESGGLSASKSGALWPHKEEATGGGGRDGRLESRRSKVVLERFSSSQEIAATIRVRVDACSYPHAGGVSFTVYVVKPSAREGFSELRRHRYLNHGEDDNHATGPYFRWKIPILVNLIVEDIV